MVLVILATSLARGRFWGPPFEALELFGNYTLKRHPFSFFSVMSDTKAAKEWAPFSKEIKLDDDDWAIVDALYEDYRNRVGVISKRDFIRKLFLKGAKTQLLYLRQFSPASLTRMARNAGID